MRRIALTTTAAAAVVLGSATAAVAQTPSGQGLTDPFPVTCPDLGGVVLMVEPPGYAPSHWTVDGRHLVVTLLRMTGPQGSYEQAFGEKRGLETITCTATHESPDGLEYATVTFGLLPGAAR